MNLLSGIPGVHGAAFDSIEAEPEPHSFAPSELPPETDDARNSVRRRLKITLNDLGRYGFSTNCPKCRFHSQNKHTLAHREHHTEQCRARIYEKMRAAEDPKSWGLMTRRQRRLAQHHLLLWRLHLLLQPWFPISGKQPQLLRLILWKPTLVQRLLSLHHLMFLTLWFPRTNLHPMPLQTLSP